MNLIGILIRNASAVQTSNMFVKMIKKTEKKKKSSISSCAIDELLYWNSKKAKKANIFNYYIASTCVWVCILEAPFVSLFYHIANKMSTVASSGWFALFWSMLEQCRQRSMHSTSASFPLPKYPSFCLHCLHVSCMHTQFMCLFSLFVDIFVHTFLFADSSLRFAQI